MSKKKFLKIGLMAFIFAFGLFISGVAAENKAEEECWNCPGGGPTATGNYLISEGWRDPYKPNIYTSSVTVSRNEHVDVWVDSGGKACPPYSWSVSGTGFHFNNDNGPTTATTYSDLETLQLWADSSACGLAEITVTEACNNETTGYVRCTVGGWTLDIAEFCMNCGGCCTQPCSSCSTLLWYSFDANDPRYRYGACGSGCPPTHCNEGGVTGSCDSLCYTLVANLHTVCLDNISGGYNTFSRVDRFIWGCQ